jgi:hypothetical protein
MAIESPPGRKLSGYGSSARPVLNLEGVNCETRQRRLGMALIRAVEGRSKRARSRFLVRYVLPSDDHEFVGRVIDLSIVSHSFDSYDDLVKYSDCKYAVDVNWSLNALTERVESLNLVGNLLWSEILPRDFKEFPISRHDWLTISIDVFLMRYVSVSDCAFLLINSIFELGLSPRNCTYEKLEKKLPSDLRTVLKEMHDDQSALRTERNARIHHGAERGFTEDDPTFRTAAQFERFGGMTGIDRFGRKINVERSFKEALVELQHEFNRVTRRLVRQLDKLYDELSGEFESRFGPKIRNATHGLNAGAGFSGRGRAC